MIAVLRVSNVQSMCSNVWSCFAGSLTFFGLFFKVLYHLWIFVPFYALKLFLEVLRVARIKPGSSMCTASILPTVLSLQASFVFFFCLFQFFLFLIILLRVCFAILYFS